MSDLLNRVGRSAFSYLASGGGEGGGDEFVGSVVEVDTMQVRKNLKVENEESQILHKKLKRRNWGSKFYTNTCSQTRQVTSPHVY